MSKIKNILFDLGGVLIDIDYKRPAEAFHKLGFRDFEQQYSQVAAGPLFLDLEKGLIGPDEFFQALQSMGPGQVSIQELEDAWNSILLGFRESSLALLEKIRKDFRLYLLSNTNAVHHRAFMEIFRKQTGRNNLDDYFDQAFYSHLIGERKPEPSAYLHVVHQAGIIPGETLFIDDTLENIDAAKKLGFQTIWLEKGTRVEDWEARGWTI